VLGLTEHSVELGIVIGLVCGIPVAVRRSRKQAVWLSYELSRLWLALSGQVPGSLMAFLGDAHKRGVLRQAGAVYQFRHLELQHRLATRSMTG